MYKYPERKKTYLTIPTIFGKIVYLLEQADAETTKDFRDLHKTNEELGIIELYRIYKRKKDFIWGIIRKCEVSPKRKLRLWICRWLVYRNLHLYEETISKFMFKHWESLYKNMPPASNNGHKRNVFGSNNEALSKITSIPIDQLDKRLTMEQKQWRSDKAIYDYYETFKQGKRVNSLVRGKMPLTEQETELIEHIKRDREMKKDRK